MVVLEAMDMRKSFNSLSGVIRRIHEAAYWGRAWNREFFAFICR